MSKLVKMPHCWKSHVTAHIINEIAPLLRLEMNVEIAFTDQNLIRVCISFVCVCSIG